MTALLVALGCAAVWSGIAVVIAGVFVMVDGEVGG